MRISVDYDACEANGVCQGVAPDVFLLDDDDDLHLLGQPDERTADQVRAAVRGCPKAALTLHEND